MPFDPQTIHLINPFWQASGGSEWRTLHLYELLRPHRPVRLWTEFDPDPGLAARYPIRRIDLKRLSFPKAGVFAFIGANFWVGRWYRYARPRRVILLYNIIQPELLARRRAELVRPGKPPLEILFASDMMRALAGIDGTVQQSPIDLARFSPAPRDPASLSGGRPFTVGRLSRDDDDKHNALDPALYRRLATDGVRVRIMGGTCLREALAGVPGVELLPACAEPAEVFLRSLDCFLYRTSDRWTEPSGRVITEAMAAGLPVVAHERGGYREYIRQGENGFLYRDCDEAHALISRLRADADLRGRVGQAARASMEALFRQAEGEIRDFYLR